VATSRGVLVLSGGLFLALACLAALVGSLPADAAVRDAVLALAAPPVLDAMRIVNYLGNWRLLLPGTVALVLFFKPARARWWVWTGLMVAAPLFEWALKHVVGRTRPEDLSYGFPSGHATAAAAFFGAVIYLTGTLPSGGRRAVRALAAVAIVLVATARVMLRAHWPSDAVGGVALGLALAAAAALLARDQRFSAGVR
jgi:undecaprenyl-diphosphatase